VHVIVTWEAAFASTVTVLGLQPETLGEVAVTVYVPGGVADLNFPCDDVVVLW
jgi:hypothetical protein